jgi:hypothetical protein
MERVMRMFAPFTHGIRQNSMDRDQRSLKLSLAEAGVGHTHINFLREMLSHTFAIGLYADRIDRQMTEEAKQGTLDITLSHSFGGMAMAWVTGRRIQKRLQLGIGLSDEAPPNLAVPKQQIYMDAPFWGLTKLSERYLRWFHELDPGVTSPAVAELLTSMSSFPMRLRMLLTSVRDEMIPTTFIGARCGENYVACPFAATPADEFRKITKSRIAADTDTDGMRLPGPDWELFPPGKFVHIDVVGVTHTETLRASMSIIVELISKGTVNGVPITDLAQKPREEWPVLDRTSWLESRSNKMGAACMKLFFAAAANLVS